MANLLAAPERADVNLVQVDVPLQLLSLALATPAPAVPSLDQDAAEEGPGLGDGAAHGSDSRRTEDAKVGDEFESEGGNDDCSFRFVPAPMTIDRVCADTPSLPSLSPFPFRY